MARPATRPVRSWAEKFVADEATHVRLAAPDGAAEAEAPRVAVGVDATGKAAEVAGGAAEAFASEAGGGERRGRAGNAAA
eukprot:1485298-Prymnesium_polylepis.2